MAAEAGAEGEERGEEAAWARGGVELLARPNSRGQQRDAGVNCISLGDPLLIDSLPQTHASRFRLMPPSSLSPLG